MAMQGAGPWGTASQVFNKFARMDRHLQVQLADLSEEQAGQQKLAQAIESGRVYGLRQQKYNMTLKKQLTQDYRHPPVEHIW